MKYLPIIFVSFILSACEALAPVPAPINSCRLVDSAKQSGGMMPKNMEEFNQCEYLCPNGQTVTRTEFGACSRYVGP